MNLIAGIVLKDLQTNIDERGCFRELIRVTDDVFADGFGQWGVSQMFHGVAKAWHLHRVQTDWWYVATGLRIGLCQMRADTATHKQTMDFLMGDLQPPRVLKIPPGVAHDCRVVPGTGNSVLSNVACL